MGWEGWDEVGKDGMECWDEVGKDGIGWMGLDEVWMVGMG